MDRSVECPTRSVAPAAVGRGPRDRARDLLDVLVALRDRDDDRVDPGHVVVVVLRLKMLGRFFFLG